MIATSAKLQSSLSGMPLAWSISTTGRFERLFAIPYKLGTYTGDMGDAPGLKDGCGTSIPWKLEQTASTLPVCSATIGPPLFPKFSALVDHVIERVIASLHIIIIVILMASHYRRRYPRVKDSFPACKRCGFREHCQHLRRCAPGRQRSEHGQRIAYRIDRLAILDDSSRNLDVRELLEILKPWLISKASYICL